MAQTKKVKEMNIFQLDENPMLNAQYHCNKHIVKMPLETAQMLCTALQLHGIPARYKPTHKGHPCTIWVSQSRRNFGGLALLGLELCKEYTYRYDKVHKCKQVIRECLSHVNVLPNANSSPLPLCMPEEYKREDSVASYRAYYIWKSTQINMEYTEREVPEWLTEGWEKR
jgi:hypothetical protein